MGPLLEETSPAILLTALTCPKLHTRLLARLRKFINSHKGPLITNMAMLGGTGRLSGLRRRTSYWPVQCRAWVQGSGRKLQPIFLTGRASSAGNDGTIICVRVLPKILGPLKSFGS